MFWARMVATDAGLLAIAGMEAKSPEDRVTIKKEFYGIEGGQCVRVKYLLLHLRRLRTKMRKIAYLVIKDNSIPVFRGMPSYRARASDQSKTSVTSSFGDPQGTYFAR
jgi:hypothetical protein